MDEDLREACACGDLVLVKKLLSLPETNVNSQNSTNGWTALHWAARRGHAYIIQELLEKGAEVSAQDSLGKVPADYCSDVDIKKLLVGNVWSNREKAESELLCKNEGSSHSTSLSFTPNYLRNPAFPYARETSAQSGLVKTNHAKPNIPVSNPLGMEPSQNALVLRFRIMDRDDGDFIEVECCKNALSFQALLSMACFELDISRDQIRKLRRLPNTVIRNDADVARLTTNAELEIVLL
eukprot:Sdes_comp20296_c0_seq3m13904